MASIRKRDDKWQVQIRRKGHSPVTRSFRQRQDAIAWAHQMEVRADRSDLPADPKALEGVTLGDLVRRYRDTVTPTKWGHEPERIVLRAFLSHSTCRRRLSELHTADFAAYRDERLKTIKPVSLRRQLAPIHNLFKVARDEWGLPIKDNPLDKRTMEVKGGRRERRLREGEWERLIDAARSRRNPYIVPIIELAVETGMRRSEILGVRWDHYSAPQRSLLIPETKNGHARTIPLTRKAIEVLTGLATTKGRVFPITANTFRLAWERGQQCLTA